MMAPRPPPAQRPGSRRHGRRRSPDYHRGRRRYGSHSPPPDALPRWPMTTGIPSARRWSTAALSWRSEPLMTTPAPWSTSASGGHGHAADAHQVGVGAGTDIRMNVGLHTDTPRSKNRPAGRGPSVFLTVRIPAPAEWGADPVLPYYSTGAAGEQAGFPLHLTQNSGPSTDFSRRLLRISRHNQRS